jgi:hypothetical protein
MLNVTMLNVIILNVTMLNVIILNVTMLSVLAPKNIRAKKFSNLFAPKNGCANI